MFVHACKLGLEGIVSKRLGSRYVSRARSKDWLKFKNPDAPAVKPGGGGGLGGERWRKKAPPQRRAGPRSHTMKIKQLQSSAVDD